MNILCLEVPSIQFQAKGMLEAETSGGAHCFIGLYSLNPSIPRPIQCVCNRYSRYKNGNTKNVEAIMNATAGIVTSRLQ